MRVSALRRIGPGALGVLMATTAINCAPHGHAQEVEETREEAGWTVSSPPLCAREPHRWTPPMSFVDAEDDGELDAVLDLARGIVALESYEWPRECHAALADRLRADYAIEYRNVGACGVDDQVVGHARGYNATMHRHIAARHGDVVEALARETGCLRDG